MENTFSVAGKAKVDYIEFFARENIVFKVRIKTMFEATCKAVFLELGELAYSVICALSFRGCRLLGEGEGMYEILKICEILERNKVLTSFDVSSFGKEEIIKIANAL